MAGTELKVILKAKDLAEHKLRVTSNCNRYPKKYRFSLVDKMQKAWNIGRRWFLTLSIWRLLGELRIKKDKFIRLRTA